MQEAVAVDIPTKPQEEQEQKEEQEKKEEPQQQQQQKEVQEKEMSADEGGEPVLHHPAAETPIQRSRRLIAEKRRLFLTPQYLAYSALTVFFLVNMFIEARHKTVEFAPLIQRYIPPGWLGHGKYRLDLSDAQWRQLHAYMPLMACGFALWAAASNLVRRVFGADSFVRLLWHVAVNLAVLYYLHKRFAVLAVGVALVSYVLARLCGASRVGPWVAWAYHALVTGVMYATDGFMDWPVRSSAWRWWLRQGGDQLVRWHTIYKITLLRLLSFGVDYNWARRNRPVNQRVAAKSVLERQQEEPRPLREYESVLHFLAYAFYVPLYMGGPVVTYNAFAAQYREQQRTVSLWQIVWGLVRLSAYYVGFDVVGHYIHMLCINEKRLWYGHMSSLDMVYDALYTLTWMYMKFLIMWRTFRLFALLDGINTHENMPRCIYVVNKPSVMWKSWHASFNRWTIRYLYVPLGGSRSQLWSAWIIFFYIGMWHGLELVWLSWAVLNCAALFAEAAVKQLVARSAFCQRHVSAWYWPHIECVGYTVNIVGLVLANLSISHGFHHTYNFLRFVLRNNGAAWSVPYFLVALWSHGHLQRTIQEIEQERAKIEQERQKPARG